MEIPVVVDGPEMFLGNKFREAFLGRNRGTGAGFGVVAEGAAGFLVVEPVHRRNVFVRAGHFHPGFSGDAGRRFAGGGDCWVRPADVVQNAEIHFFDVGGRWAVAAVEPDEHTGVIAQAFAFVVHGSGGDFFGFGGPVFPVFPGVAAGPAGHDEDAETVGLVEKFFAVHFAFEADGVEAHVFDVGKVRVEARRVPAIKHIGSPGGAANQDGLSVDLEEAVTAIGELGGDFANAEGDRSNVGNFLA